ncbi:hypothetical protein [Streptomyces sp. MMS24-I29]|uniref:hypothetical protein n=1 Tax=Streptomyces sp. MMS24-I29 TaxID=3351480 RepID=UPI003C7BBBAC
MSAVSEARAVTRGIGPAITALISGSMVLAGRACGCVPVAVRWAWDQASADAEATAKKQVAADREAQKAAKAAGAAAPVAAPEEVTAPPVAPVRRPTLEALGVFALGGVIAAGAVRTVVRLLSAQVGEWLDHLAPYRGLIGGALVLGWMAAAWMVAPPPKPATDDIEDQEHATDDIEDQEHADDDLEDEDAGEDAPTADDGLSPSQRLQRHILEQLAALEVAHGGRGGLHVVTLIQSAEQARLLSPGAMSKKAMRDWLEASKFPVAKSTRQPGGVPTPAPSDVDYGVKISELSGVLGSSVSEAVRYMYGTPIAAPPSAPVQTSAQAPVPAPAEAPPEAPAGAVAGGVPGPRLRLVQPLSPDPSQGSAQDTA